MRVLNSACVFFTLSFLIFLSSCGYYPYERAYDTQETLSLGCIEGDSNGALTHILVQALATAQAFQYHNQGGRLLLQGKIIADTQTPIGYQFDRDPVSGKQIHRLIPNEEKREVTIEITLTDTRTNQIILGPTTLSAFAEYDFYDSDSLKDASFINQTGDSESSLFFSRGQLDSVQGAKQASLSLVYQALSIKIVEGISNISYYSK